MAEEVAKRIETEEVAVTMTEMERTVRQVMQEAGRLALGKLLAAQESKYVEREVSCQCGAGAVYKRRRKGRFHTMLGDVSTRRAYYLCGTCRQGFYPLDRRLGLRPNAFSAELERLVGMTGVQLPFQKGSILFEALTLVSVSDQGMSRAGCRIGERVVQCEAGL